MMMNRLTRRGWLNARQHGVAAAMLWTGLIAGLTTATAHADMPYEQAGLSKEQAAQVLLDRFTYGARRDELEEVVQQGPEHWFATQLGAREPEADLGTRLSRFSALGFTHQQLFARFPSAAQGTAHARRFHDLIPPADTEVDSAWQRRRLEQFRKEQGYQSQETELYAQLSGQKLVRAVYARNQLNEVLTEFWLNHFHVSSSSFRSRPWVMAYENEAIRPHALGQFRELLGASVKHPAFVQATAGDAEKEAVQVKDTTFGLAASRLEQQGMQVRVAAIRQQLSDIEMQEDLLLQRRFWPATGPNLEYARRILQPTVGKIDSRTVLETARVFTGWSTLPYGVTEQWFAGGFAGLSDAGFVQHGSYVFRADRHDATPKQVFGLKFAAGGGQEEGERLLDHLAVHPDTAKQVATALVMQFTGSSDARLIKRVADSFQTSRGDTRAMLRALVDSPAFWRAAARQPLEKSPLHYAASALRLSGAQLDDARALTQWLAQMGQPLYAYLDSNGQPLNRQWLAGGALTARLNFALALGDGRIEGVSVPTRDPQLALTLAAPRFQLR